MTIGSSLDAFDALLSGEEPVDYVGTRLHAGIRALQHQRRSVVVTIDNRAREIAKGTGLPTIERADIAKLMFMLKTRWDTPITLPSSPIEEWVDAVSSYVHSKGR